MERLRKRTFSPLVPFVPIKENVMREHRRLVVRTLLFASFALSASLLRGGLNEWTSIGPDGGDVTAFAIAGGSPSTLFAGTSAGLFRSLDGANWINTGLPNGDVTSVVVGPLSPSTLYVAAGGAVFRSADSGSSWELATSSLGAFALAIDPSVPSTVYAISRGAISRSRDRAATWERVYTASSLPVSQLTALAAGPGGVLAGFETLRCAIADFCIPTGGGVLRSTNGGASWRIEAAENLPTTALALDGMGSTIYAGMGLVGLFSQTSGGGLAKSTDGGISWTRLALGIGGTVTSVAVDPNDVSVVYCGVRGAGVYRSANGGTSWTRVRSSPDFIALAVDPDSSRVWVGTYEGILTSANGTDDWQPRSHGISATDVRSFAVDPASPGTLYAGAFGGVYKSTNFGSSWVEQTAGLAGVTVQALAIDSSSPSTLYAGSDAGVFRSLDGGVTWTPLNSGLTSLFVSDLVIDPQSPSVLYAMLPEAGVFRISDNRGASWVAVNTGITNTQGYSLAIDPVSSTVYAGTYGGVFRSSNGGSSWTAVNSGLTTPNVYSVKLAPSLPSTLYASTDRGIFKTTDSGASWNELGQYAGVLAVDPKDPSTVYAASAEGLLRSTDGGATWFRPPGLTSTGVSCIAIDPDSPSTVYAGTFGAGAFQIRFQPLEPCVPGSTTLCLNGGRFRVQVSWESPSRGSGRGQAMPLTSDTGYFWFFNSGNVELAVKVVDGTAFNGHFWVFAGSLTDVAYTIAVTDTATGVVKSYQNPQGHMSSIADTSAFPGTGGSAAQAIAESTLPSISATAYLGPTEACAASPAALCLNGARFKVDVAWRTKDGRSGVGRAGALSADTGYFWFFNASNVELVVKVLDGRSFNRHHWVFYGALSDVAYTITVTDTQTGIVKTYENPQDTLASHADTEAF
jgi:photosystem II stability/assembly factor-like uncharacterized protein